MQLCSASGCIRTANGCDDLGRHRTTNVLTYADDLLYRVLYSLFRLYSKYDEDTTNVRINDDDDDDDDDDDSTTTMAMMMMMIK